MAVNIIPKYPLGNLTFCLLQKDPSVHPRLFADVTYKMGRNCFGLSHEDAEDKDD